jgi:hypothetical protein
MNRFCLILAFFATSTSILLASLARIHALWNHTAGNLWGILITYPYRTGNRIHGFFYSPKPSKKAKPLLSKGFTIYAAGRRGQLSNFFAKDLQKIQDFINMCNV